jgi:hypothetical protein
MQPIYGSKVVKRQKHAIYTILTWYWLIHLEELPTKWLSKFRKPTVSKRLITVQRTINQKGDRKCLTKE